MLDGLPTNKAWYKKQCMDPQQPMLTVIQLVMAWLLWEAAGISTQDIVNATVHLHSQCRYSLAS